MIRFLGLAIHLSAKREESCCKGIDMYGNQSFVKLITLWSIFFYLPVPLLNQHAHFMFFIVVIITCDIIGEEI